MACCGNCANGTGPCAGAGHSTALALAPRPTLARGVKSGRSLGKLSDPMVAGVSVSQGVGVLGGGWGGWALAAMAFGRKNTAAKVIAAAAGAYLGYQVVPAATDAAGV